MDLCWQSNVSAFHHTVWVCYSFPAKTEFKKKIFTILTSYLLEFWSDSKLLVCVCVCVLVIQSCSTLCDPLDCSPLGSFVHGILQARMMKWIAIPFSRGSSHPKIKSRSPKLQADPLLSEPPGKPLNYLGKWNSFLQHALSSRWGWECPEPMSYSVPPKVEKNTKRYLQRSQPKVTGSPMLKPNHSNINASFPSKLYHEITKDLFARVPFTQYIMSNFQQKNYKTH